MNVLKRIDEIRHERGWSVYHLAEQAEISAKGIYNWYKYGSTPTIETLQKICNAFGITLAQFFAEGNLVEVDDELAALFRDWVTLTAEQKQALVTMIKTFKQ
ncbi:MAG: helix-turn-helix domain-containing protein [Corallococcus sp.]|nr:helix-turn-helix domain-containing protein [Corallococcus sp.]MCM1360168.1 helix-turn-helix domain-containing protein [Corallococcus sp.]MCM1395765.1 helix-turn-helix domain-containing protein [Corallococcus sp.]